MLQANPDPVENTNPLLAVEAVAAMHAGDKEALEQFAHNIHNIGATQFFTIASVTVCLLSVKTAESSIEDPASLMRDIVGFITGKGVETAAAFGIDAAMMNIEVNNFVRSTVLPALNGGEQLTLDLPHEPSKDQHYNYIISLIYTTYACVLASNEAMGIGFDEAVQSAREAIVAQTTIAPHEASADAHAAALGDSAPPSSEPIPFVPPPDVYIPRQPGETSHIKNLVRSPFSSPSQEIGMSIDLSIPSNLANLYDRGTIDDLKVIVNKVMQSEVGMAHLERSTLYFCRATMLMISKGAAVDERNELFLTAHTNITNARVDSSSDRRFGVKQEHIDIAVQTELRALATLLHHLGVWYESAIPVPGSEDYEERVAAHIVVLAMLASSYKTIVVGKMGISEQEYLQTLSDILLA